MFLEETEGKAIIWAHYQYDITAIKDAVSKKYGPGSVVDYYGLTPKEDRQDNIKKVFKMTLSVGSLLERLLRAAMG